MNRYQQPAIFEHLALSYVLGTLQGKARNRFETLQSQHFYLKAVTEAYQRLVAIPLAQLLPEETPPRRVWNTIFKNIQTTASRITPPPRSTASLLPSRLKRSLPWLMILLMTSLAAFLVTMLLFTTNEKPSAYIATLISSNQAQQFGVVTVSRQTMALKLKIPQTALLFTENSIPVLWCFDHDNSKPPMRMGAVALQQGEWTLSINEQDWQSLKTARMFAISLEPADSNTSEPTGKIIFRGELATL